MNRVNYCIRVVLLLVTVLLFNRLNAQEIRLKVINPKGEPQFGVYVVNPRNHYLLTSTDIEGECVIKTYKLHPSDSLQFQGMGWKKGSQ